MQFSRADSFFSSILLWLKCSRHQMGGKNLSCQFSEMRHQDNNQWQWQWQILNLPLLWLECVCASLVSLCAYITVREAGDCQGDTHSQIHIFKPSAGGLGSRINTILSSVFHFLHYFFLEDCLQKTYSSCQGQDLQQKEIKDISHYSKNN